MIRNYAIIKEGCSQLVTKYPQQKWANYFEFLSIFVEIGDLSSKQFKTIEET